METNKFTSDNYFKSLSILHLALTMGIVLFGVIVLLLNLTAKDNFIADDSLANTFKYIVPAFVVAAIISSTVVFKNKINQISSINSLSSKLEDYRAASISKFAFIEGAALFSIIVAFITKQILFLSYAAVLVLFMFYVKPKKQSLITDLKLDQQESSIIEDPNGIIE